MHLYYLHNIYFNKKEIKRIYIVFIMVVIQILILALLKILIHNGDNIL